MEAKANAPDNKVFLSSGTEVTMYEVGDVLWLCKEKHDGSEIKEKHHINCPSESKKPFNSAMEEKGPKERFSSKTSSTKKHKKFSLKH